MISRAIIEDTHLRYAAQRGLEKTYCPSEVARELFPKNWRDKMNLVREVADELVAKDKLVVLQNGIVISETAAEAKGPIRLRIK